MGTLRWDLRHAAGAAAIAATVMLCGFPLAWLTLQALASASLSTWVGSGALLGRSLCLAAGAGAVATLLGVGAAMALEPVTGKLRRLLMAVLVVPLLLPSYIQALAWGNLLSGHRWLARAAAPDSGLMGSLISVWVLALSYYPIVMLLVVAALGRWDRRFNWSAWANGLGPREARQLRVRYLRLPVLTGSFVVILLAFADFAVPDFFQVRTYSTEIFIQVSSYLDTRVAMMLALPVMVMALLMFWGLTRVAARMALIGSYGTPVIALPADSPQRRLSTGILTGSLLGVVLVLIPLVNLIRMLGNVQVMIKAIGIVWVDAATGLGVAVAVACLALVINTFAAYALQRKMSRWIAWVRLLPAVLFAVPSSLLGLAAIRSWNDSAMSGWAYDCGLVLLLITTARWMPVSLEVLVGGWRQIAPGQEAAADVHGVRWHRTLHRVLLPQLRPALVAAFLLTLIFAFNELTLVTLLAPPGVSTLPLRLFQTVHYGPESLLAAICLWHIAFLLVPLAALLTVVARWPSVQGRLVTCWN